MDEMLDCDSLLLLTASSYYQTNFTKVNGGTSMKTLVFAPKLLFSADISYTVWHCQLVIVVYD